VRGRTAEMFGPEDRDRVGRGPAEAAATLLGEVGSRPFDRFFSSGDVGGRAATVVVLSRFVFAAESLPDAFGAARLVVMTAGNGDWYSSAVRPTPASAAVVRRVKPRGVRLRRTLASGGATP
jgi:hypothetical protein